MEKNKTIQDDILRYKKNKLASSLAILGLVFSCLYFMLFYSINHTSIYTLLVGFSVVLTLAVLLVAFYSSESVKNYKRVFCIVLLVLAAIQIVRIFIYPVQVMKLSSEFVAAKPGSEEKFVTFYFGAGLVPAAAGTILVVYLAASAGCFIASAVSGYISATRLEKHVKAVESGEIDMDNLLSGTDAFTMNSATESPEERFIDEALREAEIEEEREEEK